MDSNLALRWEMVQDGVMRRSEEKAEEAVEATGEVEEMSTGMSLAVVREFRMVVACCDLTVTTVKDWM